MNNTKRQHRTKRHKRVRAKIKGTTETPRISVFRSNRHIFVQVVDDTKGRTLVSSVVKSKKKTQAKGNKTEVASAIGEMLAKKAQETGINKVVFDRGGYKYHGRIKALAEGLRKGGLKF
ncbi:MAG: 50S ribosomal protein L18 [Candidatus Yanofskybacteria bacterium]|nr:50S ribosomal protein L18 [Candidatus Yanofskybacteria bacterium]